MRCRHCNERLEPGKVSKYTYYPEYDGKSVTLEDAYNFYDDLGLCHLLKNGIVKCYQEFVNMDPDMYQLEYMKLTDEI